MYAGKRLTVTIFGNPSTRFWVILSIYQGFEPEKLSVGVRVPSVLLSSRSPKHGCLGPRVSLRLMKQSFEL